MHAQNGWKTFLGIAPGGDHRNEHTHELRAIRDTGKRLRMKRILALTTMVILLTSCGGPMARPAAGTPATETPRASLPNPASAYCVEGGFKSEIRTAADGSQYGVCIFPDGSECDEWAYFRGECAPANPGRSTSVPGEIPTAMPIDPAGEQQGWWTYTHTNYNFSIMLPEDWVVEEITTSDPLMSGHTLTLHPGYTSGKESIRMSFRRAGEDVRLWPTGVGQGEFTQQGTLEIAGQPARRILLVCPTGEVTSIWYHGAEEGQPGIASGDLQFGFIYSAGSHCETGLSLTGKVQHVGEMIIASLKVP